MIKIKCKKCKRIIREKVAYLNTKRYCKKCFNRISLDKKVQLRKELRESKIVTTKI